MISRNSNLKTQNYSSNLKSNIKKQQFLRLKGKTAVFIDWANVYGWKKSLKKEVNPKKLYKYLKFHKEIKFTGLYHGTDKNEQSIKFLDSMKILGYKISTKPVKYIRIAKIVIYASGHLGREVWEMKQGIFKTEIIRFSVF